MGSVHSVKLIPDLQDLIDVDYTVVRSKREDEMAGREESGWTISDKPHSSCCYSNTIFAQAMKRENDWKVFMSNSIDSQEHACGWRRVGTFWPTKITDETERVIWIAMLVQRLNKLKYPEPNEVEDKLEKKLSMYKEL